MKKALWFDVETTGLNARKHDIIQLAAIVEINGEVKDTFEMKFGPWDYSTIEPKALEVSGHTIEELKKFPHPLEAYKKFVGFLGKYVNKYDKTDKFAPCGYNVHFDVDFLHAFFEKASDRYYGSWFSWKLVDPLSRLYCMDYEGKIALPDYKLATVCAHFNIPLKAHDALSDISATREVYKIVSKL